MLVTKDYVKDNRNTIRFGKSKNVEYFRHLIKKEEKVVDRIPKNKVFRRFRHKQNIKTLQKLIKKNLGLLEDTTLEVGAVSFFVVSF